MLVNISSVWQSIQVVVFSARFSKVQFSNSSSDSRRTQTNPIFVQTKFVQKTFKNIYCILSLFSSFFFLLIKSFLPSYNLMHFIYKYTSNNSFIMILFMHCSNLNRNTKMFYIKIRILVLFITFIHGYAMVAFYCVNLKLLLKILFKSYIILYNLRQWLLRIFKY